MSTGQGTSGIAGTTGAGRGLEQTLPGGSEGTSPADTLQRGWRGRNSCCFCSSVSNDESKHSGRSHHGLPISSQFAAMLVLAGHSPQLSGSVYVGVSGELPREKPQKGKCRREEVRAGHVHLPASCSVHPREE